MKFNTQQFNVAEAKFPNAVFSNRCLNRSPMAGS